MKQTAEFDCSENKRNRINYYFFLIKQVNKNI